MKNIRRWGFLPAFFMFFFLGIRPAAVFAYDFNCSTVKKDSGVGFEGNQSKDIPHGVPVDTIKVFPIQGWSRYRCRACYTGKTTGKMFCSCHIDSNKPDFDPTLLLSSSSQSKFGTTLCRYCISVGEKSGYSTMCYCKDILSPDKPRPVQAKPPVPKPKPIVTIKRASPSAPATVKRKAPANPVRPSYLESTSTVEDTTIINNYYGSYGSSGYPDEGLDGDMPYYDDVPTVCRPNDPRCANTRNNKSTYKKYHEQDVALAVGD